MIALSRIFGGAQKVDVAGTTVDIYPHVAKVWCVNATDANSKVRLPSWTAKLSHRDDGWDEFVIIGCGTNAFDIVDSAGSTVHAAVPADQLAIVRVTVRIGIGTWASKAKAWS
jgi:Zn-dependent alcohol dehydrogenase